MPRWPRYSLRTLLVFVALVGATMGLVVLPLIRQSRIQRVRTALLTVGLAYHHVMSNTGSPPAKLQDLTNCTDAGAFAIKAIQSEGLIVHWNADVRNPDNGKHVLGYEKQVPTRGGLAVMADGSEKYLTAGDFNAAEPIPSHSPPPEAQ